MAAPMNVHSVMFSWGANSYGQLGLGNLDDQLHPVPVELEDQSSLFDTVSGGGGHTLFLSTEIGTCCSCGWNTKGQLGHSNHAENSLVIQPVTGELTNKHVVQVACGWDFSSAITDTGQLFMWGSNVFGQLGLPNIKSHINVPTQVLSLPASECITHVACGLRHTILLTESGHVYTCGSARKGQLGLKRSNDKPEKFISEFQIVPMPVNVGKVVQTVAGAYHSAALTDRGEVLVWGDNKHGQLLHDPHQVAQCDTPAVAPPGAFHGKRVVKLYSGWTHMLALCGEGTLCSWGRSDYGQLGRHTGDKSYDYTPQPLPDRCSNSQQVACGSEHNLLVTSGGDVVSWGWNEHGMCGTGHEENVREPTVLQYFNSKHITAIGCGSGHSMALVRRQDEGM